MQVWEYMMTDFNLVPSTLVDQLNELGSQGWELLCVNEDPEGAFAIFYFKRPKA
jgi:hypothetical protein